MAWETRPNSRRPYYYKKIREGGKVRSVYLGRAEEAQQEAARRKRRFDMDWSWVEMDLMLAYASANTEVCARVNGFHKYRGVYRRIKGFKRNAPTKTDKAVVKALFSRLRFLGAIILSLSPIDNAPSPSPLVGRGPRGGEAQGASEGKGNPDQNPVPKSLCYNSTNRSFEKLQNLKRHLKAVSGHRREVAKLSTQRPTPKKKVITGRQSPCDTT